MSNEKNKHSLLVDQDQALSFYLDTLLAPQENEPIDEKSAIIHSTDIEEKSLQQEKRLQQQETLQQKRSLQQDNSLTEAGEKSEKVCQNTRLQAAKKFLQASKLRQKKLSQQSQQSQEKQHISSAKILPAETTRVEEFKDSKPPKTISNGPISPKPREPQPQKPLKVSKKPSNPAIVFSEKSKDGQLVDQILIPRSQKLAALNRSYQQNAIDKSTSLPAEGSIPAEGSQSEKKSDLSRVQPVISKEKPLVDKKPMVKEKFLSQEVNATIEAPRLDLSLFLPKIKTLSDSEIAQQIEALTQGVVSQAQIEYDLAHAAQLEQANLKTTSVQLESSKPIRNDESAPSWAVPNFQVLLFAVAGLKLAVPLNELNGIVEWGDEYITELPGHAAWYLGLIQHQGKNVPIVDTLQQVVPKNRWPTDHLSKRNFKHIILIDNGRWGLACETVLEVLTLKTDAVKWRSSRTRRRWLLGTVIEHMCALLDSSEFAAMLRTGDDSLLNIN